MEQRSARVACALTVLACVVGVQLLLLLAQVLAPGVHLLQDLRTRSRSALIRVTIRQGASRLPAAPAEPEVWARGAAGGTAMNASLLSEEEHAELVALCGRCLFHSLTKAIKVKGNGELVFVATGDIDAMWIRDSAVQLSIYFPRMADHPALRRVIEGAIRAQAFYILQDPYANAYNKHWTDSSAFNDEHRRIGRGGWVATRNYELDSGAYFLNMLWNYYATPGLFAPERFLNESIIVDAVRLMLKVWQIEQHHEERSTYRYFELPRQGKGPLSAYTGMSWSGYRPSDDPQVYGYNIPVNMYAAGSLEKAVVLNERVWHSDSIGHQAALLAEEIREGIEKFGVVDVGDGTLIYAYEVDGMGGNLSSFDDPNVPSLLSIPLLGYKHYSASVYEATRHRILSSANQWHFVGSALQGLGSPHTPRSYVWPLAMTVQGLTAKDDEEKAFLLRQLLASQCGNGLMHESVDVNNPEHCTRDWFEWANAMAVVFIENALGMSCDEAAESHRHAQLLEREQLGSDPQYSHWPLFYETLEAGIQHIPHRRMLQNTH